MVSMFQRHPPCVGKADARRVRQRLGAPAVRRSAVRIQISRGRFDLALGPFHLLGGLEQIAVGLLEASEELEMVVPAELIMRNQGVSFDRV